MIGRKKPKAIAGGSLTMSVPVKNRESFITLESAADSKINKLEYVKTISYPANVICHMLFEEVYQQKNQN